MHWRPPYSTKVKVFSTYLTTIFLYNSELWTFPETMVKCIDAFQRKVLRIYVLNVKYPQVISNEEVYRRTGITPWSTVIKKRRLKWLGHCSRLDKDTPAAKAMQYATSQYRKRRGRPQLTWLKQVENQLNELGMRMVDVTSLANDKTLWRKICRI